MFDKKTYMHEYSRQEREYAREHGLCIVCRRRKARPNRATCEHCAEVKRKNQEAHPPSERKKELRRALQRALYAKRKSAGVCPYCGRKRYPGQMICYECYIKRMRKNRKKCMEHETLRAEAEGKYGDICQKCLEPALPGKRLCQKHYEIILDNCTKKANDATRRLLAEAKENGTNLRWAQFKELVLRKGGAK